MTDVRKPTVLFDGGCPLCTREIAFYRTRRGADMLAWTDISAGSDVLSCGISRNEALARFHVIMPDGSAKIGAEGFVEIWRQLPAFRWLARIFGNRAGLWLLDRGYDAFLRIRPRLQRIARR